MRLMCVLFDMNLGLSKNQSTKRDAAVTLIREISHL